MTAFSPLTISLDNTDWTGTSHQGNPFDVEATATFTYAATGEVRTTGMYYDGNSDWRFRFPGNQPGEWTFTTASGGFGALDNRIGTIDVAADPTALGFLTTSGTKYARQIGSSETLKAQPYVIYQNSRVESEAVNPGIGSTVDSNIVATWGGPGNAARRGAYIDQALAAGANAIFLHVNNQWFQNAAIGWDDHSSTDPDRAVFAAIEDLIVDARASGVQVNIWAWGDEGRKWTPIGVGGINGPADRRIQRYIADRLGPLPGWSMGYGFDLFEWVTQEEASDWANFLNDRMGWDHNLSARAIPLFGPDGTESSAPPNFLDGYASLRRSGQILQTDSNAVSNADDGGPDTYLETLNDVQNDPMRPILYEERHIYRRWPTTSMDGTRKLLWWWTMAGGAGGWIGFGNTSSQPPGFEIYPNPEQLRTFATFWEDRLDLDMAVDNGLTGGIDELQYALYSQETGNIVIFAEETDSITLNLDGFTNSFLATLVDAEATYAEIELGILSASDQTLDLSSYGLARDWALLLTELVSSGDFDNDNDVDGADFLKWQQGFGGIYNATHLTDWLDQYGSGVGGITAGNVVPEPNSYLLMMLGWLLVMQRTRSAEVDRTIVPPFPSPTGMTGMLKK